MENQRSDPVRYIIWTRQEFDAFGNVLSTKRFIAFRNKKKGEVLIIEKWIAEQLKAQGAVEIVKPKQEEGGK